MPKLKILSMLLVAAIIINMATGCASTSEETPQGKGDQDMNAETERAGAPGIAKKKGGIIKLEDSVEIAVPLDKLYEWMMALDQNFVGWHPNHEYFRKLTGGFEVGDQIQFKELVMGVPYDIKGTILEHRKSDNEFYMMFETFSGVGHIFFIGESTEKGCTFTHIEEFGKPATFFGSIYNWFVFEVAAKKKANWQLILNDMIEDNINLKQILETGVYPAEDV